MSAINRCPALAIATAIACGLAAAMGITSVLAAAPQTTRLTLERISSTRPKLDGTSPLNPVWSPDSRHLAFMWDDAGMGDRSIWLAAAAGGPPRRLIDLAKEFPAPPRGAMDADQLRQATMMLMRAGGLADMIWTPDSTALVVSHEGQLVQIPTDGSPRRPLADSRGMRMNLAFGPDGRVLAFIQQGLPMGLTLATGEVKPLATNVPEGVRFNQYKWSPDGRMMALIFNERPNSVRAVNIPNYLAEDVTMVTIRRPNPADPELGASGLALLDIATGAVRLVRPQGRRGYRIGDFSWSSDSRHVLVDEFSEDTEHHWISVVDAGPGAMREVWHDQRPTRVTPFWHAAWRRDGKAIIFLSNHDGWHHIYSLPLDGSKPVLLTPGQYEVIQDGLASNMDLIPATGDIFFVSTQKSPYERQVYRLSEMGGPVKQVTRLPGLHRPTIAPNGRFIATLRDDDLNPIDLYIADTQSGEPERQITRSPLKEFYDYTWAKPRYVTFKSHVDGDTLHARIVEPPNLDKSKKYPVILGPVYRDTARNSWGGLLQQYLVQEGQYIIAQVDMRGSVGYGRTFQEKVFKSVGGIEVEDLESTMRYFQTIPYADTDRAGIYGGSYGGLVTLMAVFKKPTLFKAAVAHCPASSLWHGPGLRFARSPKDNPDAYRDGSPISFGEDLQARLMIIHGTQDANVLFQDTIKLVEKLVTLGKNFDFVVVPSAGHCGGPNPNYAYFTNVKHVEHFDRYVKNAVRSGPSN